MKLHLGCGNKYIDGFVNVDILNGTNVDIADDVGSLEKITNDSADLIYACHVLEHFGRNNYKNVLNRWHQVLKTGGTLRVAIPDIEACVNYYNNTKDLKKLLGFFYGGQTHQYNFHYMCWDFNTLKLDLESVGFKDVRRYDWRTTEHSHIDDYSQAYLPHMDKENGQLMSLNVEATK